MTLLEYIKLAAWCAGSVAGLFVATHAVAKFRFQESLALALRELNFRNLLRVWPSQFTVMFDAVFGPRPFSLSFFLKSCVASFLALIVVMFVLLSLVDKTFLFWLSAMPPDRRAEILLLQVFGNFIPDYLSLVETRLLLGWLVRSPTVARSMAFLVLDLWFTAFIFAVIFPCLVYLKFGYRLGFTSELIVLSFRIYLPLILEFLSNPPLKFGSSHTFDMPIQLYTTFFTSLWLWLFVGSFLALKVLQKFFSPVWVILRDSVLNIEERPILALGWLAAAGILVLFAVAGPFVVAEQDEASMQPNKRVEATQ